MSKKNTRIKKVIKPKKRFSAKKDQAKASAKVDLKANFKIPNTEYVEGIGRRKVANARVRIYEGEGDFVVNNKVAGEYFTSVANANLIYNKPFDVTKTRGQFAVTVKVTGSGVRAQLDAVAHGLSRALLKFNPDLRSALKKVDLLSRDDRMKETRKIGTGGKARRKRQSPKR